MIKKVKMYAGQCDCCGEVCEHWHHGWTCLTDESAIEEMMTEQGWYVEEAGDDENRDLHYCQKCHSVDDNDTLIVDWSRKSKDLSAPASPVEEKPVEEGKLIPIVNKIVRILNEKLEAHGDKDNGIRIFGRTEAAYNIERLFYELTASKPSPVIETGETPKKDEFIIWVDEQIQKWARLAANERGNEYHRFDGKRAALIQVKEKYLSVAASHPAPAPIVGEREEEDKLRQQLLAALEETSEAEELAADRLSLINFQANQIAELKSQVTMWRTQLENFRKHFTDSGTF